MSLLWLPNNFFFSTRFRHIFWCIKIRTRFFINLSSMVGFSKKFRQGVPCKAESWNALLHEQYFSKYRFLDVCRCACTVKNDDNWIFFIFFAFTILWTSLLRDYLHWINTITITLVMNHCTGLLPNFKSWESQSYNTS